MADSVISVAGHDVSAQTALLVCVRSIVALLVLKLSRYAMRPSGFPPGPPTSLCWETC